MDLGEAGSSAGIYRFEPVTAEGYEKLEEKDKNAGLPTTLETTSENQIPSRS